MISVGIWIRNNVSLLGLAVLISICVSNTAHADATYPTRPVHLLVPFGAGGIADIQSRIIGEELGKRIGQPVVIENRPGAFGIPAALAARNAAPDGYTLALFTNGTATSVSLTSLPFDPVRDFVPVANVVYFDFLIVVNADSKYQSAGDLIAAARATPGKLNIGTTERGGSSNLAAVLFTRVAAFDATIVTYRSSAELPVALMRNDVGMVLDNYAAFKPLLEAGRFRALAVTSSQRSAILPDVPTVAESGLAGFDVNSWNGWFAPVGTPRPVIEKLNNALREVVAQPSVRERLLKIGVEPHVGSPEEMGDRLRADIEKWRPVISQAGIERR
jgi:tripartite-type tricarboxylate transporter receptor subunit TctC